MNKFIKLIVDSGLDVEVKEGRMAQKQTVKPAEAEALLREQTELAIQVVIHQMAINDMRYGQEFYRKPYDLALHVVMALKSRGFKIQAPAHIRDNENQFWQWIADIRQTIVGEGPTPGSYGALRRAVECLASSPMPVIRPLNLKGLIDAEAALIEIEKEL